VGKIGAGYGSEFQLMKYLDGYRAVLDAQVLRAIGRRGQVKWLPRLPAKSRPEILVEWKALAFLPEDSPIQRAWREFWPQGRGIHNWDAVGWVTTGTGLELLLVEAKTHVAELRACCAAASPGSLDQITRAMATIKQALGVPAERDWLRPYYQFCNRVAALHFLHGHGVKAHLLFIYFVGDTSTSGRKCPQCGAEWQEPLNRQALGVGLPEDHLLTGRVHKLFLHVAPTLAAGGGVR
jgi:hypothetical protein